MNRDSSKGWIQRKNPGEPEWDIYNKYSVQSIWNCKEDSGWGSTKQHDQYADSRKEKLVSNRHHYNKCNHRDVKRNS